jgi:WD40 repeat protein/tRNA A-37 threonylcarbamoyl transferase component Bud32
MADDLETFDERRERLEAVIGAYLEAVDAGHAPDPRHWVAQHPDLEPELVQFLADQARLERVVGPVRLAAAGGDFDASPANSSAPAVPTPETLDQPSTPTDPAGETTDLPPGQGPPDEPPRPSGDEPDPPRGSRVRYFGDYELLRVLGRGGMGVVYKARQRSLNRMVAVKMIRAGLWAGDESVRRFRNEAEAVANLDHSRIVTIHEVGEHEGQHYFSMKLVDGPSLGEVLPRYAAEPKAAARLVAEVSRAVHHAHQRGILHRDLKPSNILLDADGHPHVTDFGLAKRVGDGEGLSVSGSVLGTPAYMSPEQASGRRAAVTTATDVYGLGAVLYAALTGRPPFQADEVLETLEQVRTRAPERPGVLNPRVDRDLETICLKCLEKDPKRRYDSAAALADDLERLERLEPILARRTGRLERAALWARRRPTSAALLLVSIASVLTLVGGAVGLWYDIQLRQAHRETEAALKSESKARTLADQARAAEQNQRKQTEAALGREQQSLYFNRILLAEREWQNGNIVRVRQLLDECPPELRSWEWNYLRNLDRAELGSIRLDAKQWVMAFSPEGTKAVVGSTDGHVEVLDVATGQVVHRLEGLAHAGLSSAANHAQQSPAALSRDGRVLATSVWIAGGDAREVQVWDLAAGREVAKWKGVGDGMSIPLSPNGTMLAGTTLDKGRPMVTLWDAASGKTVRTVGPHNKPVLSMAFSPDGRRLLVGAGANIDYEPNRPGDLVIWDVGTGEKVLSLVGHSGAIGAVAFSPDGRLVASTASDKMVRLWDVATGREVLRLISGYDRNVNAVEFSPDGRLLASSSTNAVVRLWDVATGRELPALRGHLAPPVFLRFQPDSSLVSNSTDGVIKRWDLATDPEAMTLRGHATETRIPVFSPDDRKLATNSMDGLLKVWDPDTGQVLLTVPGRYGGGALAFSPDGKTLAADAGLVCLLDASTGRRALTTTPERGVQVVETPLPGGRSSVFMSNIGWRSVAFSPDGRSIAAMRTLNTGRQERGLVTIWDAASGKERFTLPGHPLETVKITTIVFSPDGRRLVTTGCDSAVHVYDLTTRERVHRLEGHSAPVIAAVISPDGRLIASASDDTTIKLWDATTGAEIRTLRGHTRDVVSVAFSPDGKRLVSGSNDETLKLWDVASGQEILTLRGHAGGVSGLTFSHDGQKIASCSADGTIKIWEATPLSPRMRNQRRAAEIVNRLTSQAVTKEELTDNLRSDPAISEPVRREALTISERFREDPGRLFIEASQVISRPGASVEQYTRSLRRVERAAQLDPANTGCLNMVGIGHYRLGQFDKAKDKLEQADSRYRQVKGSPSGASLMNLAFLARTYQKLGKSDQAKASLDRLRQFIKQPPWSNSPFYQSMLREAESTVLGTAASAPTPE